MDSSNDQSLKIQETIFRNSPNQPILVKGVSKEQQFIIENIGRTQTFQKPINQFHIDSPVQSHTPTMKNQDSLQFNRESSFPNRAAPRKPHFVLPKYDGDYKWPFFRLKQDPYVKQFWTRRTAKDQDKNWNFSDYLFQGNMLRIGRKKKNVKGYYYRLTISGLFLYYKKQSDSLPKGFIQLNIQNRVTVALQKTKKNIQIPVLYIEKVQGIGISIFDHQIDHTLRLAEALQEFCLMRGFDALYSQEDQLGSGAFGTVYRVSRRRDEKVFAAKVYYRDVFEQNQHKEKFIQMIYNEIQCLKSVIHPALMNLFEIYQEKERFILIMEQCSGGTLYQLTKQKNRISEKMIAIILRQLCEGLSEMHRCNYVHRDLKLENVMFDQKESTNIKIIDFGFAEIINEVSLASKSGTPGFMAPEIFRAQPYTSKGDIFSLGVMTFLMASGFHPFKAAKPNLMQELNKRAQYNFDKPIWNEISVDLRALIKKMMELRPEERPSCYEILDSSFLLHHTRQTSETNYKSIQMVSGLEVNKQSIKSIKHSSNESKDFQLDFSIHTNDIKSLYQRNSQRTANSQKSNKSHFKHSHKLIQTQSKSVPRDLVDQYQKARKQTQPNGQKNPMLSSIDNMSFDGLMRGNNQKIFTFPDFEAMAFQKIIFLKRDCQVFNQAKKPTL